MSKSEARIHLDDELLAAVRREAARSGRAQDEVIEAALRRYVEPSILDRIWARNRVGEDDAMKLALEEIAAMRADRQRT